MSRSRMNEMIGFRSAIRLPHDGQVALVERVLNQQTRRKGYTLAGDSCVHRERGLNKGQHRIGVG